MNIFVVNNDNEADVSAMKIPMKSIVDVLSVNECRLRRISGLE